MICVFLFSPVEGRLLFVEISQSFYTVEFANASGPVSVKPELAEMNPCVFTVVDGMVVSNRASDIIVCQCPALPIR